MIVTDFIKQTFLRIGSVVTIPIRTKIKIDHTCVIWNETLGTGEIKIYLSDAVPSHAQSPAPSLQDSPYSSQSKNAHPPTSPS